MLRMSFAVLAAVLVSACFGQVLTAMDYDSVICVGVSSDLGYFGISLADGRWLTYGGCDVGGLGTIHMNFYIDGRVYSTDPFLVGATPVTPTNCIYSELENVIVTDWFPEDSVQFTQTLHPFSVDSSGAVTIRYTVINNDSVSHDVGVLFLLDTNINGRDDAPFTIGGDTIAVDSTLILPYSEVPSYWQVFELGPWEPDSLQVVARGVMEGGINVKPDWLVFGDVRSLASVVWDVASLPAEAISDGAVLMRWGPVSLDAGEAVIFATTYGLAPEGEFIGGPLGARVEVPHRIPVRFCALVQNPFFFSTLFRNNTDSTMYDVYTALVFDSDDLELDPPAGELIQLAESLRTSEMRSQMWQVNVASPPLEDTYYRYTLIGCADTTGPEEEDTVCWEIVVDSIFIQGSSYTGPTAELLYPLDGTYSSNPYQPIAIYLTDDDTLVSPLSIHLGFLDFAGDTMYEITPGLPGCTYENDTLYFANEIHRSDGERVRFYLRPTFDYHGCPLSTPLEASYICDFTPPVFADYYPIDDDYITDSLVVAWMYLYDGINRVDTLLVEVEIADDESTHAHTFPDPLLVYDAEETLRVVPEAAGWRFPDGDVTLTLVQACDAPDYGEPNCTETLPYSWSFVVNAHGPRAYPRTPDDGWFVSIPNPDITFYLYDGNGIDVASIEYTVDGVSYGAPSDFGERDSIIVHTPTEGWENGYVVCVRVVSANDLYGVPLDSAGSHPVWSFTIDLTPPYVSGSDPADGGVVGTELPRITVFLDDSLAGVDPASIVMVVDGDTFTTSDAGVSYSPGELVWDGAVVGDSLVDTVEVCVSAADAVDMGEPNVMEPYCFSFVVVPGAPDVIFTSDFHSICAADAAIEVVLDDPDGVDESSIEVTVDGTPYTTASDEVSFEASSGALTFTPSAPWVDGDSVEFCVTGAADVYGHALVAPVCRTFVVDLAPPQVDTVLVVPFERWEPDYILDSLMFIAPFVNDFGEVDSGSVAARILVHGTDSVVAAFTLDDDNLFLSGDTIVLVAGALVPFEVGGEYDVCFVLDDGCYAGSHDATEYCYAYLYTSVGEELKVPVVASLLPNYPDPFNAQTVIPVFMPADGVARVEVYDISGRLVETLWSGMLSAGLTVLRWNGCDSAGRQVPSGVYFVRLRAGDVVQVSRMALIR